MDKALFFSQHANFDRRFACNAVIVTVIAKFYYGCVANLLQAFHIAGRYAIKFPHFVQGLLRELLAPFLVMKAEPVVKLPQSQNQYSGDKKEGQNAENVQQAVIGIDI